MVYRSLQLDIYTKILMGSFALYSFIFGIEKKYCLLLKSVTKSWVRLKQTPSPKQSMYVLK